jgi:hypothetical protein
MMARLRRYPHELSNGVMLWKYHTDEESHPFRLIQVGIRIASNLGFARFPRSLRAGVTLTQRAKNPLQW